MKKFLGGHDGGDCSLDACSTAADCAPGNHICKTISCTNDFGGSGSYKICAPNSN